MGKSKRGGGGGAGGAANAPPTPPTAAGAAGAATSGDPPPPPSAGGDEDGSTASAAAAAAAAAAAGPGSLEYTPEDLFEPEVPERVCDVFRAGAATSRGATPALALAMPCAALLSQFIAPTPRFVVMIRDVRLACFHFLLVPSLMRFVSFRFASLRGASLRSACRAFRFSFTLT